MRTTVCPPYLAQLRGNQPYLSYGGDPLVLCIGRICSLCLDRRADYRSGSHERGPSPAYFVLVKIERRALRLSEPPKLNHSAAAPYGHGQDCPGAQTPWNFNAVYEGRAAMLAMRSSKLHCETLLPWDGSVNGVYSRRQIDRVKDIDREGR